MNDTKLFTFEFTLDQTNLILQGLSELPFKTTSVLINKIHADAQMQMEPPAPEKKS